MIATLTALCVLVLTPAQVTSFFTTYEPACTESLAEFLGVPDNSQLIKTSLGTHVCPVHMAMSFQGEDAGVKQVLGPHHLLFYFEHFAPRCGEAFREFNGLPPESELEVILLELGNDHAIYAGYTCP